MTSVHLYLSIPSVNQSTTIQKGATTILLPQSLTFDSAHPEAKDAKVHRVTFTVSKRAGAAGPAGTPYVSCTCDAGRFYWQNLARGVKVTGCWAMKVARATFNIPTPPFKQPRWG